MIKELLVSNSRFLIVGFLICIAFLFSISDAKAKFWGWEKSASFSTAYLDGTVCETYTYYVCWVAVESKEVCGPCCSEVSE